MPTKDVRTKHASLTATVRQMAEQAHELRAALGDDPHADSIAQAALCAAPILAAAPPNLTTALNWLYPQLESWEQSALDQAQTLSTQLSFFISPSFSPSISPSPPLASAHLYDTFLHHYSRNNRKHRGVFFTPAAIANYIVAQLDRLLREECGFPNGLADGRVTIIDPACGTGIFLLAIIDFLSRTRRDQISLPNLLARLIGIEILPPATLLTKLNLALKLSEIGYDSRPAAPLKIFTADALSPNLQSEICNLKLAFPVLLGNPPFSSLSTNSNPWIARLVRGDDEIGGYIRASGQQLGERKTWLHDDYVKFIRLAQWHVEQAGCGLIGFVTNHGYLDNATFRLMRHELLRVFSHIEILDLHGNRRSRGTADLPAVGDENIFHLDQGIAISLLCRPPTLARSAGEEIVRSTTKYAELWGSRDTKLAALAIPVHRPPSSVLFVPRAPEWRFRPVANTSQNAEYTFAWSLADAMPVNTTAPVTARDSFVVAFTPEELITRLNEFRDLTIPDDKIRHRYFQRTRSARYPTGDTRSWKLTDARRIIAADSAWQETIIRCLYRPFDWRYIFWHPAMIDWPRTEVTRHLIGDGISKFKVQGSRLSNSTLNIEHGTVNLCLIARRQQLPTQPCTFYWISDCLALDGVIRSDNRGSESLFPLYVTGSEPRANFAPLFIEQFSAATLLTWQSFGRGNLTVTFGPEDLLAYIYALFHSPNYRAKYSDELRRDFPRILPPLSAGQFAQVSRLGHELIDLHLLRAKSPPLPLSLSPPLLVSPSISSFRAGGHVALKKWLQPQHRSTSDADYHRIVAAIDRTVEIMGQIDTAAS